MPISRPVRCLPGVFHYANPQNRLHITEKRLALMRDIVKLCELDGRILDPFAGAGTTVFAAVQEGYEAVDIEVTDAYYGFAVRWKPNGRKNQKRNRHPAFLIQPTILYISTPLLSVC